MCSTYIISDSSETTGMPRLNSESQGSVWTSVPLSHTSSSNSRQGLLGGLNPGGFTGVDIGASVQIELVSVSVAQETIACYCDPEIEYIYTHRTFAPSGRVPQCTHGQMSADRYHNCECNTLGVH